MKVFVTGASGFIGGHITERLARAHEVLALARSAVSDDAVRALGARAVRGELGSVPEEALRGCDAVVHAAAYVGEWGTRQDFWSANVEGTAQLLAASKRAGVRRFIHIGTEAALFDGGDLLAIDESHPYPTRQRFLYSETKAEAERRVLAAGDDVLATLSLRPRLVWGPRDSSVRAAVERAAKAGRFMWLQPRHGQPMTSTTHVANLVHAVELSLSRGRSGQAYFVADDGTRSLREFLTRYLAAHGTELGDKQLPASVARAAAAAVEGVWRVLGLRRAPPMTRFAAAMMSATITVRTDKARAELGYAPVASFEQAMAHHAV